MIQRQDVADWQIVTRRSYFFRPYFYADMLDGRNQMDRKLHPPITILNKLESLSDEDLFKMLDYYMRFSNGLTDDVMAVFSAALRANHVRNTRLGRSCVCALQCAAVCVHCSA